MCKIFTLSKGERLNSKIERDIHIIKFTGKDTKMRFETMTFQRLIEIEATIPLFH